MFKTPSFYSPVTLKHVQLESGETHYSSFRVVEAEKNLTGYQPQPGLTYLCHVTDQRLIFEVDIRANSMLPATTIMSQVAMPIPNKPAFQIPLDQISTFKTVRSLNLTAYAQIILKVDPDGQPMRSLTLAVTPATQRGRIQVDNCAGALVGLGKDLLTGSFGPAFQPNPAAVAQFKEVLSASQLPVVVGFSATSCEPCQMFEPVVDDIAQEFGDRLQLIKVNVEQEPSIPMEYGIDSFPTLMLFKDGKAIETITGAVPKVVLTKVLNKFLVVY